jgi:glutamate---cysteine ligase / carboxylate-amine ligase
LSIVEKLTFGVEEEFLLVDQNYKVSSSVNEVISNLPSDLLILHRKEFHASQLELVTNVHTELSDLHYQLVDNRLRGSSAAELAGIQLMAVGVPIANGYIPEVSDNERYSRVRQLYAGDGDSPDVSGCHVHVGVPSDVSAAVLCNYIRPYLPLLQALMVNSPIFKGIDTGHASWRHTAMKKFPTVGISPYLDSDEHYYSIIHSLLKSEVFMDENTIHWYVRPSRKYPTIEIRIGDISLTAEDATLVAAITRALVAANIVYVRRGIPPILISDPLLVAAHWRAARFGLEGEGVDPATGELRLFWEMLDSLVLEIAPILESYGDIDFVLDNLDRFSIFGTGADRQRQIHSTYGIDTLLRYAVEQTKGSA